jgi:choline-sulfatase
MTSYEMKFGRFIILLALLMHGCQIDRASFKNVVVILADDHALKVTGTYGNDFINTPSIDLLSSEGITFSRAYCNAPICSASRQSLLTGKYPHATGVNLLFTPFPDEGNITIAEHLREHGYRTAIIGKTHWNNWAWSSLYKNGMPDHGFDLIVENGAYKRFVTDNPPPAVPDSIECYDRDRSSEAEWMNWRVLPHPIDDAHSMGTFFANEAISFIDENEDNPFFLWLAFKEPHHPYYFPVEYAGKYDPNKMPLPKGSPEDDRWIPEKYKNLTEEERRGIIASYYTSTEYLDKNIGLVLDVINERGLEENTLVIYISDNGYLLNEHKRFEKHTMWEEAIRQPMVIKAGHGLAGLRSDALIEYIDVMPTILDFLGISVPEGVQGASFRTVIDQPTAEFKEIAFSEYLEENLAMVCTKDWKYVFTTGSRDLGIGYQTGFGPSGIVHRMYNLVDDPNECHNVSKDAANADILQKLQQSMLQRFMETHPDAQSCPEELTLEGKLVWFCEPRDVGVDQSLEDVPVRVFPSE